ncbi:MAG: hypothetical protein PHV74_06725 [Dehalococcoidia bacterium]|nr:hypothetical protein [Dehalococcoidia bacterium]
MGNDPFDLGFTTPLGGGNNAKEFLKVSSDPEHEIANIVVKANLPRAQMALIVDILTIATKKDGTVHTRILGYVVNTIAGSKAEDGMALAYALMALTNIIAPKALPTAAGDKLVGKPKDKDKEKKDADVKVRHKSSEERERETLSG